MYDMYERRHTFLVVGWTSRSIPTCNASTGSSRRSKIDLSSSGSYDSCTYANVVTGLQTVKTVLSTESVLLQQYVFWLSAVTQCCEIGGRVWFCPSAATVSSAAKLAGVLESNTRCVGKKFGVFGFVQVLLSNAAKSAGVLESNTCCVGKRRALGHSRGSVVKSL